MNDKVVWSHLCKELAKAGTVVDLYFRVLESALYVRKRYQIFTATVLDSYTRSIILAIYILFDKKYSWNLYNLYDLSPSEKNKLSKLQTEAKEYIDRVLPR